LRDEVLIIGCGKIGSSLIDGWLNKKKEFSKKFFRINVLERSLKRQNFLKKKYKKRIYFIKIGNIKKKFKYVFLSLKPKDLNSNLNLYKNLLDNKTIIYSVLAGKQISDINNIFPINKNIIRLMLNTPISFNYGTIVFYSFKSRINKNELFLLNLVGNVYGLKNEKFFDLITVIVGSGPAYFYYLLESMEKTAISHGLNRSFAKKILMNTYDGTGKLILNNFDKSYEDLRKNVTSKGGTTEAAIKCLKENNFKKLIYNSIKNSIKKAKILGSKKVK
jgi:pyrroline-5-carboxylate reductase